MKVVLDITWSSFDRQTKLLLVLVPYIYFFFFFFFSLFLAIARAFTNFSNDVKDKRYGFPFHFVRSIPRCLRFKTNLFFFCCCLEFKVTSSLHATPGTMMHTRRMKKSYGEKFFFFFFFFYFLFFVALAKLQPQGRLRQRQEPLPQVQET